MHTRRCGAGGSLLGHGWRQVRVRLRTTALVLALVGGLAAPRTEAACGGVDLFPELKATAQGAFLALETEAAATPYGRGRLFRITRPGLSPSFVYGTLHLPDPRVAAISEPVASALAASGTVIFELPLTERGGSPAAGIPRSRLTAAPGRKPEDLLAPKDIRRLQRLAAARGLPKAASASFSAVALALMLDLPSCATARGATSPYAEQLLTKLATERGATVTAVETLEEQLEVLGGLDRNTERDLLTAMINQGERAEDVVETSIARWLAGDTGSLVAWMRSSEPLPGIPEARLPPAFLNRLLNVRSRRMAARAIPHLERGGAFMAVGAAHLPGSEGILALLAEQGFTIEAIE